MLRYFLASEHFLCKKSFVKTKFPFCQLALLEFVLSVLKIFHNIQKIPTRCMLCRVFILLFKCQSSVQRGNGQNLKFRYGFLHRQACFQELLKR